MELDEFKMVLKMRAVEDSTQHTTGELQQYIHRKTASVIDKVKQSILFEFIVSIFFVVTFAWAWFRYPFFYVRCFAALSIALCIFFLTYLVSLYKTINYHTQSSPAVKDSLLQIIDILQRFTRLYFKLTMIMLPVAFIFGLITGYLDVSSDITIKHFNWIKGILFYTGWFIFWSAIMYFFTKWYIKKLYGNYLHQLKEQLKELENG